MVHIKFASTLHLPHNNQYRHIDIIDIILAYAQVSELLICVPVPIHIRVDKISYAYYIHWMQKINKKIYSSENSIEDTFELME